MADFPTERRRRLRALALLAGMALLSPSGAAQLTAPVTEANIDVEGSNPKVNLNAGTLMMRDVTLRQGPGTLIRAQETSASGLGEGYENSQWEFKGAVHIEFNGAVLDADSAVAQFVGNRIQQVRVMGSPAHFSHQLKDAAQRNQGRAQTIDYNAATGQVRLAGGAWYSDGRNEVNTATMLYNVTDGSFTNESTAEDPGRVILTIRPGKRVPPPRTPERSTAQ
jgi:lipopolysaccharide transport protein LptA